MSSMQDFHNQLLEEGALSVLFTQFLIQSGHEIHFSDVNEQISETFKNLKNGHILEANSHQHLAVQYYCGHLPLGESIFCDYVWRFWEMDFVQVSIFLGMFATMAMTLGGIIGVFEYQKKVAFSSI